MRIDQLGRPAPPTGPRVRRRQDGFVVEEEAASQEPALAAPAAAPTGILAAAGAAPASLPPAQLDREAAAHGDAMLKTLTRLQLAALGTEGSDAQADLAALAGSLKQAADPGLNAVLQAIAARAAVEVARAG